MIAKEMTAKGEVLSEREISGEELDAVSGGAGYNSSVNSGPTLNDVMIAFYNGIMKGLTSK